MKRRDFIKGASVIGATAVVAPNLLLAKNENVSPYELKPGEMGIIFGLSGSGKTKLLREFFYKSPMGSLLFLPAKHTTKNDSYRDWDFIVPEFLDKEHKAVFFDELQMINEPAGVESYRKLAYFLHEMKRLAIKNKYPIWVTLQQNRSISLTEQAYYTTIGVEFVSVAIHVYTDYRTDNHIHGEIIKDRFGNTYGSIIDFGLAKNLGTRIGRIK